MAKKRENASAPGRRGSGRLLAVLIVVAAVAVGVALSLTVFFNITEIAVEGQYSVYSEQEIVAAAGISPGDNLLRLPVGEISDRLETELPYLLGVSVERRLPGTVIIRVNDVDTRLAIPCSSGYLIVSDGMKILEVSGELPAGCPLVYGITPSTLSPGSQLETEEEFGTEYLERIVESAKNAALLTGVSSINVADRLNLSLVFDNRVFVLIGTASELDYKLQMMDTVLQKEGRDAVGHLDISMPGKAFFSEGSMRVPEGYVTFGPDIYSGMHPGDGADMPEADDPSAEGEGDPEGGGGENGDAEALQGGTTLSPDGESGETRPPQGDSSGEDIPADEPAGDDPEDADPGAGVSDDPEALRRGG